jgi:hypothetical protein
MTTKMKPTYEDAVDALYRKISATVKKARDKVGELRGRGRKIGEIENLMEHDTFNYWELPKAERENIGISGYESTVEKPLTHEASREQHGRIYDEIVESFIHSVPSIYLDSVTSSIISNIRNARKKNEATLADNIQRAKCFLDAKGTAAQNHVNYGTEVNNTMVRINEIRGDIETDIAAKKSKLMAKNGEIERLEADIRRFEAIINERKSPNQSNDGGKTFEEPTIGKEILSAVGDSLATVAIPFIFIGGKLSVFFKWIGEHSREFTAFIRKIATQPAFWVTILFAIVNGFLFRRLFSYMFADSSMVLMLIAMFVSVFAILPFCVSKHLRDFGENADNRATKALLAFDVVLVLVTLPYLAMAVQHRHIYAETAQVQLFAAIAIGLMPFFMSIVTGFMNYNRLKSNSAIAEAQNSAVTNEVVTQVCETEVQSTETELIPEDNVGNNREEEIVGGNLR